MRPLFFKRSQVRRAARWLPALVAGVGIFAAYRWSEPSRVTTSPVPATPAARIGIHMENTPFVAYSGDRKAWSLWARSIDLDRAQYSSATSMQGADITDIRDGVLFAASPGDSLLPLDTAPAPAHAGSVKPAAAPDTVLARFHAKSGRYSLGPSQPLPGDVSESYRPKWQLQLTGDVSIVTRDGDSLTTDSLTIMSITNQRTGKSEQRIECNSGAAIHRQDVKITSNRLRYSLNDHTVELLDGVRGAFKKGSIQSQRAFWQLNNNVVQVPDQSTGILDEDRFAAEGLTLDFKRHTRSANHIRIYFRTSSDGEPVVKRGR